MQITEPYVQNRDGVWYVGPGRVQVYSVIARWQEGFSPEEIQSSFPVLSLREVYGTILHYLEHRDDMDAYFREEDALYETRKAEAEAKNPEFYAEIRERIARFREWRNRCLFLPLWPTPAADDTANRRGRWGGASSTS
jgi:hypothetical protein